MHALEVRAYARKLTWGNNFEIMICINWFKYVQWFCYAKHSEGLVQLLLTSKDSWIRIPATVCCINYNRIFAVCVWRWYLHKVQTHKAAVQMVLLGFWPFERENTKIHLASRAEAHHCSLKRYIKCIIAEIWRLDSGSIEVTGRFPGLLTDLGWLSICWTI